MADAADLQLRPILDKAKTIINRAEVDIGDLNREIDKCVHPKIATVLEERDPKNREIFVKLVIPVQEIPIKVGEDARKIAVNIWTGLNDLVRKMAFKNGASVENYTFPTSWSNRYDKLVGVQGKIDKLPKPIRPIIRALQPYKGGDGHGLWAIRELAISQHDQVLEYAPDKISIERFARGNGVADFETSRWYPAQKRVVLFSAASRGKPNNDIKIPLNIVFYGLKVFYPEPAMQTLLKSLETFRRLVIELDRVRGITWKR